MSENSAIVYHEYPIIKPVPRSDLYELQKSLKIVYRDDNGEIKAVRVPKGFLTDGASIPRFLWEEVASPYDPRIITAAIVHDYHCDSRNGKTTLKSDISIDEMSDLFFDLLMYDDVGLVKSFAMESAVRIYKSLF